MENDIKDNIKAPDDYDPTKKVKLACEEEFKKKQMNYQ